MEDSLTINDPFQMSEGYNQIYAAYESIMNPEHGAVDDYTTVLSLDNTPSVATYKAWDAFNIRGRQRGTSNAYARSNYFEDETDRKARKILLNALNNYIRRLEGIRYGYNRIATLYSYLMYSGLYGIMTEIYIPDYMKETVDQIIDSINNKLDELINDCAEYFAQKNNEDLNSIIHSLGRIILAQRTDQVFETLKKYDESLNDDDFYFLSGKREEYLKYQDNPQLNIAKTAFGLSDGSYYRNLNVIITDLVKVLDEDSYELLTELFLKG